ncbi:MAG: hypothetical protein F6K36_25120 [Symploca sp. SIO3C6]|uniref:Uncharacterized protein n=1 Tax=Symploca sp. SIO1C4 TaxID=2607765 RepID=A0A6B3N8K9_9CYAN|nr:hypothetical protein [Symploca sp. SIO3C6]NER27930.1 hypothetical protein [Symploca sp. SIO1C4]NET03267.1 hypothetical protein [Symploca sp. SIO2B6]
MNKKLIWYIKAQAGVLLFPLGLCLFGEAVSDRIAGEPWFWLGTLSLVVINAGVGLMIESGLISGFPKNEVTKDELKDEVAKVK